MTRSGLSEEEIHTETHLPYAELHCHSYYSLLDATSTPEALVARAKEIGLAALALTDHDSLAGAVRFWTAAQRTNLQAIIGAEITLEDNTHLTLLAENQQGYADLCRLVTASRLDVTIPPPPTDAPDGATGAQNHPDWSGKVEPALAWSQLEQHSAGLLALSGCRHGPIATPLLRHEGGQAEQAAKHLLNIFDNDHLYVELQHHHLPDDDRLIRQLVSLAGLYDLPVVATNNVHYADRRGCSLRDALIAIRHNEPLAAMRRTGQLPLNSNYHLCSPAEITRRFCDLPLAVTTTMEIAQRCQVSLDFTDRRLPAFLTPNRESEFAYLYQLCHDNLPHRYPDLQPDVLTQLAHELNVIAGAGLAGYFLIVWDIVNFARTHNIRCQGRGSAANSIVAYLLGITSIDPLQHNLLFERFLSTDKFTTPDIDIDFAADRREEVIQYVYSRYGAAHTAMVCNTVTYRARSALSDLGKALSFPVPVIDRLVKSIDTHSPTTAADHILEQISAAKLDAPDPAAQAAPRRTTHEQWCYQVTSSGATKSEQSIPSQPASVPDNHPLALLSDLMRQIDGCPRHLSIHSGGMLITGPPLDEVVPLEPATMPGRVICQWNKESVEDAGLIKIDLLGLRTLGLITDAIDYVTEISGQTPDLDSIPLDDPALYRMLQRADTIGTFQVESRAQQQMLPRLKPTKFEDIIVEVAIVRPGPIQGGAVHPYLRRRAGEEPITYLHPSLEPVLAETMGVLLFQEQAIRLAVAAAGFSAGEADMLRRALSRSHSEEAMAALRRRFVEGAQEKGIGPESAAGIFEQLAGFAGYGFCKSHAASFALIAYQTLYLKQYHPAPFYCALFNQQPMGFYSPEVIAGDARRHGVDLLPPHINRSDWKYTLEKKKASRRVVLRTGLRAVTGLGEQGWQCIAAARQCRPFSNLSSFCLDTRLPKDTVTALIRAGALDSFGSRRQLLWQLGDIEYDVDGSFGFDNTSGAADLPELLPLEQTLWEHELLGLSPGRQIMSHYRSEFGRQLRAQRIFSTWEIKRQTRKLPNGRRVRVAGMVVVRQRPSTAKGITFLSLEDESGLLDLVIKPPVYARVRQLLNYAMLIVAEGIVQRSGSATSVLIQNIYPLVNPAD